MRDLNLWKKNAQELTMYTPTGDKTHKVYIATLGYIHDADWSGACHATTSIITTILRVQGISAEPYIGECRCGQFFFDHSWVEVDGEVFDAAVSNTLIDKFHFPPVYRGIDLSTMQPTSIAYGVASGNGYDPTAEMIRNMSVAEYMKGFPGQSGGLFGIAETLTKVMGGRISAKKLEKNCSQLSWRERI